MTTGRIHAIYAGVIISVAVLGVILAGSYAAHVKADAERDSTIKAQKDVQDQQAKTVEALNKQIEMEKQTAATQMDQLEKRRVATVAAPEKVPAAFFDLLKQMLPQAAPIKQDQQLTKDLAPDAPSATLTKQNQIDLFNAATSCKQCLVENAQLSSEVEKDKQVIIAKDVELDSAKIQRDAALKDAKGGSVMQRTWRVVKWGTIFGGIGYVLGRAHK